MLRAMSSARRARSSSPSRRASARAFSATDRSLTTGPRRLPIARTGSRGKRTCPTSSATAPPMRASRKRDGEGLAPGCSVATTRMPEIAAWLTRICPAPNSSAAAIESPTTSMRTRVLAPSARTMTSATTMPTATPTVSSIARTVRPPRDTPMRDDRRGGGEKGLRVQQVARGPTPRRRRPSSGGSPRARPARAARGDGSRRAAPAPSAWKGGRALGGLCPPAYR